MFAIAFDLKVNELKENYGDLYNQAYDEITAELATFGFEQKLGSLYLSQNEDLTNLYEAITKLSNIDWFKKSVRDIKAFKVENWSDFTDSIKR
jgi:virulence-associated protein VapD